MKRCVVLALVFCAPSGAQASPIATFENFGLPANSFNNNAGPSGFFVSGGQAFNNTYITDFGGYWYGWAISTMTDTTTPGFTNQYSAITGAGANGSLTYAVASTFCGTNVDPFRPDASFVNLATGTKPISIQVTNSTFGYLSMRNGDAYAKKFGPGDFFRLIITGYDALGGMGTAVGAVEFYLADFRGGNASMVDTWQTVDLTSLAGAKSLRFGLESSDNHPIYGLNTPASFAADNLTVTPEPTSWMILAIGAAGCGLAQWRRARVLSRR